MDYQTLGFTVSEAKAWVTLNRPDRLNAINRVMVDELGQVADLIRTDDAIRVVILTGGGAAFCVGADLYDLPHDLPLDDETAVAQVLRKAGDTILKWWTLKKPVIAAINGAAIGGGLNLALMCDLTVARADAVMSQIYVQRGLVLDMGGSYFLPKLVGMAKAKELALLGDVISAAEAERIGMINKCVEPEGFLPWVEQWAGRLAQGAGWAIGMTKMALIGPSISELETALEHEAHSVAQALQTKNFQEAMRAFKEKRDIHFSGA